jgi:hypothetical protein
MRAAKFVTRSTVSSVNNSLVIFVETSRCGWESEVVLSIDALREILYLTAPDAYRKDDGPVAGIVGADGWATGEFGEGEGALGGELLVPLLHAMAIPERKYQYFLVPEIFM